MEIILEHLEVFHLLKNWLDGIWKELVDIILLINFIVILYCFFPQNDSWN